MKYVKYLLLSVCMFTGLSIFAQSDDQDSKDAVSTDWKTISLGKLQKNPRFKEPMISVRFMNEDGKSYFNLSLKYMFTDAVFEEAVPVEYFKNQKIEFATSNGKYELNAVRYAKARRMNTVVQKTADIRVLFSGDLSFLKDNLVENFVVHYAQGYQTISLNKEEAEHLKDAFNHYQSTIAPKPTPKKEVKSSPTIQGAPAPQKEQVKPEPEVNSLDQLRKRAKNWKK